MQIKSPECTVSERNRLNRVFIRHTMKLISHWYFTTCMRMRPKDAAELIAILDALEIESGSIESVAAALSELQHCDVWARVYAAPLVLRLAQSDQSGSLHSRVEQFVSNLLSVGSKSEMTQGVATRFHRNMELLLQQALNARLNQPGTDLLDVLDETASYLLGTTREAEDVPYLGLPRLIEETLYLAAVGNFANTPNLLVVLRDGLKEENCSALLALLRRSLSGELGRMAAIEASEILHRIGAEGTGKQLAQRLCPSSEVSKSYEPDIACQRAWLETFDSSKGGGQARTVLSELEKLGRLSETPVEIRQSPSCASRIGIRHKDLGLFQVLMRACALVAAALPEGAETLALEVANMWSRSGGLGVILTEDGDWHRTQSTRNRKDRKVYTGGDNSARIWSLAVAAVLGLRIAVRLQKTSVHRDRLLMLALHAESVFARQHDTLLNDILREKHHDGNDPLSREVASMALYARTILKEVAKSSALKPQDWLSVAERNAEVDPRMLTVLVDWIEDFMLAPPNDLAARMWRQAIPSVLTMAGAMDRGWGPKSILKAELLGRFFCDPPRSVKRSLPWQEQLMKRPQSANMLWLNVLALPCESGREWLQFDFIFRDDGVSNTMRTVAAVERFLSSQDDESESQRANWREAVIEQLSQVFQPQDINRWLRHRLVSLVAHPDSGNAGKLAVQLLVQFGQPADVTRLANLLLNEDGRAIPDLEWKLRCATEGLASRADYSRRSQMLRTRPVPPHVRMRMDGEIDCWLTQCAALLAFAPISPAALRLQFREMRERQMGLHRPGVVHAELTDELQHRHLTLTNQGHPIPLWAVEQIVEDPARGLTHVLYRSNGGMGRDSNAGTAAIVLTRDRDGGGTVLNAETGTHTARCDFGGALEEISTGDVVWVGPKGRATPVKNTPVESGLYSATARRTRAGLITYDIGGSFSHSEIAPAKTMAVWDADTSRVWRHAHQREIYEHLVVRREGRTWRPAELGLHDLIARSVDGVVPFRCVLTVVTAGVKWLFSTDPGTLFALCESDFDPSAWRLLQKHSQRSRQDPIGLRISVTASRDQQSGSMSLGFQEADIDRANLLWRDLFEIGAPVLAVRSPQHDNDFVVHEPGAPDPFPKSIRVRWADEFPPRQALQSVTAIVVGWEDGDRRGVEPTLCVAQANVHRLGHPDEDLLALHSWISGLSIGTQVELIRSSTTPRNGIVVAQTVQHLAVQVSIESLTLLPAAAGMPIPPGTRRKAVLTQVKREVTRDIVLSFDPQRTAELNEGDYSGRVIEIPRSGADHAVVTVLVVAKGTPVVLHAVLQSREQPRLGAEVVISRSRDGLRSQVVNISLFAEGLFESEVVCDVPDQACFVGMTTERGKRLQAWVDPQQPHRLLLIECLSAADMFQPRRPYSGYQRLLRPLPWRLFANHHEKQFRDYSNQLIDVCVDAPLEQRSDIESDAEHLSIAGWCQGLQPVNEFHVRDVELRQRHSDSGLRFIKRVFVGYRLIDTRDDDEGESLGDQFARNRKEELIKLKNKTCPLDVIAVPGKADSLWQVRLQDLKKLGFSNVDATIDVPQSELHHFHYGQEFLDALDFARVMLKQDGDEWLASFRDVPSISVAEYRKLCDVELNEEYRPRALLFIGYGADRTTALMEFGPGYVVEVPNSNLIIDEIAVSEYGTALYHGDRIKRVRFALANDGSVTMKLYDIDIEYGSARRVLFQARAWQVVHTLVMEAGDHGEPRILIVQGFNEGADRPDRDFSVPYASIAKEESEAWQRRLEQNKGQTISVYAKLNISLCDESQGRVCEFRSLNFTFGAQGCLKRGDLLLVEAGTMNRTSGGNDIRLDLHPLSGVQQTNPHAQPEQLIVLRREFSVRESLMARYLGLEDKTSNELDGMVFAVRVCESFEDGGARASLLGLPSRKWRSLLGSLRAAGGTLFGSVAALPSSIQADEQSTGADEPVVVRLEVRPGMFFELTKAQLDHDDLPSGCSSGTLVRLALVPESMRVRITVCQFGPSRYLQERPLRPGVVLPLNHLLRRGSQVDSISNDAFTALDFPGQKFTATYWNDTDSQCAGLVTARDLAEVMSVQHPKFAWLGYARSAKPKGGAFLVPAMDDRVFWAGQLVWNAGADVWFRQIGGQDIRVQWMQLSFADVSMSELKRRSQNNRWFAHDTITGRWCGDDRTELISIPPITSESGPIFATADHGAVRLRYNTDELFSMGSPLNSLVDTFGLSRLKADGACVTVTVVSVSSRSREFEGLWIEWSPGRVIEIPIEMLTWRSGPELVSLASFDWSHMSFGDELTLRLIPGDTFGPDRIELLNWRRGTRGSGIGNRAKRALLPVAGREDDGSLILGCGDVTMTLPTAGEPKSCESWYLTKDNRLLPSDGRTLAPGDVVLITIESDSGSKAIVAGMETFVALPSLQGRCVKLFEAHPLGADLIQKTIDGDRRGYVPGLIRIIRAAGGAIPVTVEYVDYDRKIVLFSFRNQMPTIRPGGVSQAFVLGWSDKNVACLRVGAGIVTESSDNIICDLPDTAAEEALNALRAGNIPVWLSASQTGNHLTSGLCEDGPGDVWVECVAMCGALASATGLIVRSCRTQRLYWIPQERLSWSDMTGELVRKVFLDNPMRGSEHVILAHLHYDNGIAKLSLIDTVPARRELEMLRPGHEMQVMFISEVAHEDPDQGLQRRWCVQSLATKLTMRCDVPSDWQYSAGHNGKVEIAARVFHRSVRILCAPQGYRRHPVHVPRSLLEECRAALDRTSSEAKWRAIDRHCATLASNALLDGPPSDATLSVRLAWSWELSVRRRLYATYASRCAGEWIRVMRPRSVPMHEAIQAIQILCAVVCGGEGLVAAAIRNSRDIDVLMNRSWNTLQIGLGDLHRRCLKSVHLGTIMSHVLSVAQENDRRCVATCRKLLKLLEDPVFDGERAQIERLATLLLTESGQNLRELGGGFMATLGIVPPPYALPSKIVAPDGAGIVDTLTALGRICSPYAVSAPKEIAGNSREVSRRLIQGLDTIRERCQHWPCEVELRRALPSLSGG